MWLQLRNHFMIFASPDEELKAKKASGGSTMKACLKASSP